MSEATCGAAATPDIAALIPATTCTKRRMSGEFARLALHVPIEQFDRYAFRPADEAYAHARPHRGGGLGELHALGLETVGDGVDALHRQAEMVEALVRRR